MAKKAKDKIMFDELRNQVRNNAEKLKLIEEDIITKDLRGSLLESMNFVIQMMKSQQQYLISIEKQLIKEQIKYAKTIKFIQVDGSVKRYQEFIKNESNFVNMNKNIEEKSRQELDRIRRETKRAINESKKDKEIKDGNPGNN